MAATRGASGATAHTDALSGRYFQGGACGFACACCDVIAAAQGGRGVTARANTLSSCADFRGGARSFAWHTRVQVHARACAVPRVGMGTVHVHAREAYVHVHVQVQGRYMCACACAYTYTCACARVCMRARVIAVASAFAAALTASLSWVAVSCMCMCMHMCMVMHMGKVHVHARGHSLRAACAASHQLAV